MQNLRWLITRLFVSFVFLLLPLFVLADVSCCTWNMKWFPSGRGNLRAKPAIESERSRAAGEMILRSLEKLEGGCLKERSIVFLQEVRDAKACTNLVKNINIKGMQVASVSEFKDSAGFALWQQTAILTTLPVVLSGFKPWAAVGSVVPPRGFAYAILNGGEDGTILCMSVHLKSNLNRGNTELENQTNIYKRESCVEQVLEFIERYQNDENLKVRIILAGDFNTDEDNLSFVSEATLRALYAAQFKSCFWGLKKEDRITCPGRGRYEDATFDYILYKGFPHSSIRAICDGNPISDHNIVSINLKVDKDYTRKLLFDKK